MWRMPLLGVITIRFFLHFQNQIAVVCKYALFWRTEKALHQRVVGKNEFLVCNEIGKTSLGSSSDNVSPVPWVLRLLIDIFDFFFMKE